jgi:hypothetical protein
MIKLRSSALAPLLLAALVALAAACTSGRALQPSATGRPMTDGESIGEASHLVAGAGTPTGVRTLLSVGCQRGELTVHTNMESIIAGIDCTNDQPAARYQPFLGQIIAITYTGGRLRFENPTAGTLEVPVQQAKVYASNATP